ncbi:MAG: NBR1-Ig-like domain-containing protein [Chloroflexota bacterium]
MRDTNRPLLILAVLVAAMLACTVSLSGPAPTQDPNVAYTSAAQTVSAQLTSVALSRAAPLQLSPTASQIPSNTVPAPATAPPTFVNIATATTMCDKASFVDDVTVEDNTTMTPGQTFTKTWRLRNVGSCSWTPSYAVVFSGGDQMGGPSSQALTSNVNPGQTVDISIDLTAPATAGAYRGDWKLRNASGTTFILFYVQIIVAPGGGGAFAVTDVTYALGAWSAPGFVNCPRVTAFITVNGAGTITYTWTRSDGSGASSETLSFPGAGTKAINYDWARGSAWAGTAAWVGIFINDPNNQDFGHLNFMTACASP